MMISYITGKVFNKKDNSLFMAVGNISYEVMVPGAVLKALGDEELFQKELRLVTYHYYQMQTSRAIPVLIGFKNEIEKEFFENFISVSGVGPKAACKALVKPFSSIAAAIDAGDIKFLRGLPGIGSQRARQIIAKLQGKVGKYCLIRDKEVPGASEHEDIKQDALEVLLQLQYTKSEAERMLDKVLDADKNIKTPEELLNEVYKQKKLQ